MVKLANRIESLKMQEDEEEEAPGSSDMPAHAREAAGDALAHQKDTPLVSSGLQVPDDRPEMGRKRSLSKLAKGAIFKEVVLAKVREMKDQQEHDRVTGLQSSQSS